MRRAAALALLLAACTCPGSGCPDAGADMPPVDLAPAADLAPERCGQQGYCPGAGRCCAGGYCETCARSFDQTRRPQDLAVRKGFR